MKRIKRFVSMVLSVLLVLFALPVTGFAASSEIWPGYPGVDQLPAINTIPDPFKFFDAKNDPNGDGYVSTPAEWDARRNEIRDLVQHYWLGYRWPTDPKDVLGETKDVEEPNTEYLISFYGWNFVPVNLGDEFEKLETNLKQGKVVIHKLENNNTSEGAIQAEFGPAATPEEAEEMAIEAWNAGYYIPYSFFGTNGFAALKDKTGPISAPPGKTKMVKHNVVTITNPDSGATANFNISVTTPSAAQMEAAWGSATAQVPTIIDIGGSVSQVSTVTAQGYAYINFTPTDIYPDDSSASDGINRDGVYTKLYPYNKDVYEYASGAEMAWGWGVSQIISALKSTTGAGATWGESFNIDPNKTLVTGHSRYGKASIFAAAFDDRISICLASESGGSGIHSYRYKVEGKIFNFNVYPKADRVYGKTEIPTVSYGGGGSSWFPETAANFVNKDNQLPFDSSDIISLVAPRPFFATTGIDAAWMGNEGAVAAVQAASEVYDYIGSNDIEKTNIAVRARESDHMLYNRDVPFVIAIMDREFKQTTDKTLHVKDLFPTGSGLGNVSYPAKDYTGVSGFNSYPFDINSSYLQWSSPNKYTLWTAQENFLVGHPVTITAHSNAPDVKLYLPDKTTVINAATHQGDEFTFNLTAEQAIYGRYELRTVGDDKNTRSVFFAAVSLADSLRHGMGKGDEGEENRLIGFSSRLANTPSDAPVVTINGQQRSMSFAASRFVDEDTSMLEYGILFHDKLFADIAGKGWDASKTFDIKNLKFVTIPGFTFEVSFGNVPASAGNSGKDLAANFVQPISWNVEKFNNGPAGSNWPEIPDTQAEKDTLAAGGTITRPDAPAPKATNYKAKLISTNIQKVDDKTNVTLGFDTEMDTREYGFGTNATGTWDTVWSADKKSVTLSMDYDKFPTDSKADIIIFRLKDAAGNMIPGPTYLSLNFNSDYASVNAAIDAIHGRSYQIPLGKQADQATKNAWVKVAVNSAIPVSNGTTAEVTYDNGYVVTVTKGSAKVTTIITVTEEKSDNTTIVGGGSTTTPPVNPPVTQPTAPAGSVTLQPALNGSTASVKLDDAKAKDLLAKDTTVVIPEVANAKSYEVTIPASSLSSGNGDGTLSISTKLGKVTIPDNMLKGISGVTGKDTGVSIGQGSKDNLPAEVKATLGDRPIIQLSLNVDGKQTEWNNPGAPVSVSIPYTPTADELKNTDSIVVWYIDGSGKAVTVPNGRYDAKTGMVTFTTTHFSQYAVAFVQKTFSDTGSVTWAKKSIEALTAKDILKTTGNTFDPKANITRADFLYSLVRTLGANATITGNFDDISKDSYYYNEIAIAKALGITDGQGNNKFGPNESITRQDMMAMTERALKLVKKFNSQGQSSVLDKFTDKGSISSYAVSSVATIVSEGLIEGNNNKITPKSNTTRAEAAVFLYRIYNKY